MAVIKNDLKSIVEDRLRNYPVISKHLGGIISIDVKYWNVEHSVLLKTLIERDTKPRAKFHLDRLENALRLGEKHCANFELIFKNIESEYRSRGEAR
jgi:hypothetical protein